MREKTGNRVKYHYTKGYGKLIVERLVNVPLEPNANHEDLPKCLSLEPKYHKSCYSTLYQRLGGDDVFRTALTSASPSRKGGSLLHPHQKRVYTVREAARCQGFPDNYQILSVESKPAKIIQDQYKQIGNAVPIPLGMALGREIGKALMKYWKELEEKELIERELSPEIGMQDLDERELSPEV